MIVPRIITALDLDSGHEAIDIVKSCIHLSPFFKIGPQLLLAAGPSQIETIISLGARIFLDLKFHDIPTTVFKSARAACRLRPVMFDVHSLAGPDAIRKAAEAANELPESERPIVLAITLLVSHDSEYVAENFREMNAKQVVLRLADAALKNGAKGLVCSATEAPMLKERFGSGVVLVCPGVRSSRAARDEYPAERVVTPFDSCILSADFIVIGRPIVQSPSPPNSLESFIAQLNDTQASAS